MSRSGRTNAGCLTLFLHVALVVAAQADPSDGLVAHWRFNDRQGAQVRDASSNDFDGGLLGGGDWTNGVSFYDGAVVFDGVDDKVIVPAGGGSPPVAIGALTAGSIAIRFRFPETGSGNIIPLFYFGESSSGSPHHSLIIEIGHGQNAANRRLYFTIVNARFCYDSGSNLPANAWHHFVAVVRTNGNTGYLNGQEMTGRHYNLGSDATNTNFFNSVPVRELLAFAYGRYGQQDPFFHGPAVISDVRIYSRPLTLAEAQQLQVESDDPDMFAVGAQPGAAAGDFVLTWPGTTGYYYAIWQTPILSPAAWATVTNKTNLPGVLGVNAVTVRVDSASMRCYRIEAQR